MKEKTNLINKIISAINNIAEETSLLSVNASIEAAGTQMDSVTQLNQVAHQLGERANELVDILGSFTV